MAEFELYQTCRTCGGDGLFPNNSMSYEGEVLPPENPGPCGRCDGTGKEVIGLINLPTGGLINKLNTILGKCNDILEKLED